jgi:hypothetical protein
MSEHQDPPRGDDSERPDPERLDAVARKILELLQAGGPDHTVSPDEVARAFAEPRRKKSDPPDVWRRYLNAVNQQAVHLARAGRIVILRRGEPQDPHAPIKGLIRLGLPK